MFGGFGSRFAKFGAGGGGRSIASATDLLQLFKRGSENGVMIDELDNTTDLTLPTPSSLLQTDAVFISGTINFWSTDGATHDTKTFTNLNDHYSNSNGAYGLWVKTDGVNVSCIAQYPIGYEFSIAQTIKNERYFGGTSAGLRDVNGDLITTARTILDDMTIYDSQILTDQVVVYTT